MNKTHDPTKVTTTCPLCVAQVNALSYDGHGGWLLCPECGKAWHPDGYLLEA